MYHNPVLLKESIEALSIKPNGTYVDATFGGGGHSKAILDRLSDGKLYAFDRDEDALKNAIQDKRFLLIHTNYSNISSFLQFFNAIPIDGIIADLGVSSHQFDTEERGFSSRFDARLDARMSSKNSKTAWDVINLYDEYELRKVFFEFGEIIESKKISQRIVVNRAEKPINTTLDLFEVVKPHAERGKENKLMAQVMQALRIEVNEELKHLGLFLNQLPSILKIGGRAVIISYHSLEDRPVKNFFKSGNLKGEIEKDFYGKILTPFKMISKKPIIPSEAEIQENPRSRSAKMRIVEKI
jgi:16S rRNA (cytosine1402-N4)-methyltransferase